MRIVAALCWYLEPPAFLDRCVRSLEGVVDRVVALDGAWRHFPDAGTHSTLEEGLALHDAARRARLLLTLETPDEVFESQTAKRAALMALASEHGDWLLVIDGDEHVKHAAAPLRIRRELAATDADVAEVGLTNIHEGKILGGGLRRRFYRSGTTVEIVHSGYTYQGRQLLRGEPTLDLGSHIHIEHDYANRGADRNQQAREYVTARASTREEVWV